MPITPHIYGKTSSKLELLTFTFLTILPRLKMTLLFMVELCDRNCVVLLTDKATRTHAQLTMFYMEQYHLFYFMQAYST